MSLTRRPASAITQTGGALARAWPVSPLLTAAATTLAGLWLLRWLGPAMLQQWQAQLMCALAAPAESGRTGWMGNLWPLFGWLAFFVAVLAVAGILVTLLQRGGMEPPRPPDQPRQIFGFQPHHPGLMPLAAVGLLIAGLWKLWIQFPQIQSLLGADGYPQLLELFFDTAHSLVLLGLAAGLLDLAWRHYARLAERERLSLSEADSDEQSPLFRRQMRERMSRGVEPGVGNPEAGLIESGSRGIST